jgi:uncharacterized protein (DUF1810 family)
VERDSLSKFVEAQNPVYEVVCAELVAGQKVTHWMWFIFPQLKALGRSPESVTLFHLRPYCLAKARSPYPN